MLHAWSPTEPDYTQSAAQHSILSVACLTSSIAFVSVLNVCSQQASKIGHMIFWPENQQAAID